MFCRCLRLRLARRSGLLVETVALGGDGRVGQQADGVAAGGDAPLGGPGCKALGGEKLLPGKVCGLRLEGEEHNRTGGEGDEVGMMIVEGDEA